MVYPNGRRFTHERQIITVDDWRDTIFGPCNFGFVSIGPMKIVEI